MDYWVVAYYLFIPLDAPAEEVLRHKAYLTPRDVTGRIYLSTEGINGQLSAPPAVAQAYMQWLKDDPRFQGVEFKIQTWPEHCFPRLTIKQRAQLVALDRKVDLSKRGIPLSPREWRERLENRDDSTLLVDVRNRYEWEIGHFEGAELPAVDQFRAFKSYTDELKKQRDPRTTTVLIYCTGGIRCELYSALMKEEGFEKVYQLEGGILNYGFKEGVQHWRGRLFVFDDRLSVPLSTEHSTEVISHCSHCPASTDLYFNCANMDCNELFLACPSCAQTRQGCCCTACETAPRRRPFVPQERPKPFRRLSHLFSTIAR